MIRYGGARSVSSRRSLGRDILWALALKAVALTLLYFAFFGPSHRVAVTPDRVAARLIGSAPRHEGN